MKWWATLVALVVLAGCGGSAEPEGAATASAPTVAPASATPSATPSPAASPSAAEPSGEPAPEALSSFRCEPASGDKWSAAGFLANSGKKAATYQVSVYVGPLDGVTRRVRTKQVANVASGGSVRFELGNIVADGSQCHVQVIRIES